MNMVQFIILVYIYKIILRGDVVNIDFKVVGLDTLQKKLDEFLKDYPNEVAGAVYSEAETIMTLSKKEVPTDTSALKDSGFVEKPIVGKEKVSVKLGYGGVATKINPKSGEPTTSYAEIVHENLLATHPSGKAKYLEDPIREREPEIAKSIVKRVKIRLAKTKAGGG